MIFTWLGGTSKSLIIPALHWFVSIFYKKSTNLSTCLMKGNGYTCSAKGINALPCHNEWEELLPEKLPINGFWITSSKMYTFSQNRKHVFKNMACTKQLEAKPYLWIINHLLASSQILSSLICPVSMSSFSQFLTFSDFGFFTLFQKVETCYLLTSYSFRLPGRGTRIVRGC